MHILAFYILIFRHYHQHHHNAFGFSVQRTEAVVEYLKDNPSAVADFDYRKENPRAPQHWGDLKKEWSTCKYGKRQSPIAIWEKNATKVVTSLKDLVVNYKPANATIKNEEHAISVRNTNSYLIVYV